jgi:peptidyl-prolyl cis-trans isomerase C
MVLYVELFMKRFKMPASQHLRVLAGCLSVLLVIICIQGCKKTSGPQGQGGPTSSTTPGTTGQTGKPKADAVAVTVNGTTIMESQLEDRTMKELNARAGGNLAQLDPAEVAQAKKMMRPQVIESMVLGTLVGQQIKAAGIAVTDQDVVAAVNVEGSKMSPPMTFDQYKKAMIERGADFNDVMTELKNGLSQQKFLEAKIGKADVNEAQAKAFYDTNQKMFERPEQVRASHILVAPDPNVADPNQAKIAAKAKAQKLLTKIKEGADFAQLAKTDSNDSSAANGGDLGFFARGEMVKPFEDVAFALEPNKVSDPVETQFGYHIIKMTEHRPGGVVPFDEIKANLIARLSEDNQRKLVDGFVQSLRAKAKIVYTSPADAPAPQPMLEEPPMPTPTTPKPQTDANSPKPPADANQKK